MAGSIQPNEIIADSQRYRRDNSSADTSARVGGVSGFSSQLEGLMEAATIEVEALAPEKPTDSSSDLSATQQNNQDSGTSSNEEVAQETSSPDRPEANSEPDTEGQNSHDQVADVVAELAPEADTPVEDGKAVEVLPVDELPAQAIVAAPDAQKAPNVADDGGEIPSASSRPESAEGGESHADLDVDIEASTDNADLESDAAPEGEELSEVDASLEGEVSETEGASDADGIELEAESDDTRQTRSARPSEEAPKSTETTRPVDSDGIAKAEATPEPSQVSEADQGDAEAVEPDAGDQEIEIEAPESAEEGEDLREARLERRDQSDNSADSEASQIEDVELAPSTSDDAPETLQQNRSDVNLVSSSAAQLVSAQATTFSASTQAATASVSTASEAASNSAVQSAAAQNSGPAAPSEGQSANSQSGDGSGAKNGENAQRARAAKPVRLSKAMHNRQIEVVKQISKSIGLRSATRADGRMNLLLSPEALGTISLELHFDGDGMLHVEGATQSDATRHLLTGSVEELRNALRQENIDLARFVLNEGNLGQGGNAADSSRFGQEGGNAQGSQRGANQALGGGDASQEVIAADEASGSVKLGEVDLQA